MDAVARETAALVAARGARLVTAEEASHWSLESHTFHFELMKRLHRSGGFTAFSSERLGRLDAFLMNAWLQGRVDLTLDQLYDRLPFGGLGTYRWMEYFKRTRRPFALVGLEIDDVASYADPRLLPLVRSLCSPEFARAVTFTEAIDRGATPKTDDDATIKGILDATPRARGGWRKHRLDAWFANIRACLAQHGNLFINGFHLSRGAVPGEGRDLLLAHRIPGAMSVGVRSFHAQRVLFRITDEVLRERGWTRAGAVRAFERDLKADGYARYGHYARESVVADVHEHSEPNAEAERLYGGGNGFALVESARIPPGVRLPGTWGASMFPVPGKRATEAAHPARHDCVVFIPRSTLHRRGGMRM